ncbi:MULTISPECIES: hypothetical protein [unclassified Pseudomonas]|uniref:hypothetical protein n=1 Tax=unclassified Pseudomonas TaxID=196821 RepID=UPI00200E2E86|nr:MULTISPECIES: hypothetical protein [unclassified Pseudomonas]
MLVDIPDSNDFYISAENLINGAWNCLVKLLENHEVFENLGSEQKTIDQYWTFAKPDLTSALAMVQNAVEFYLKAKILSISPYLLISLDARLLPKKSEINDISFSDFRTLDAQDLLKVHNTFSAERLTDEFKQWFDGMRSMRNKIMHTVDKTLSVEPSELARSILMCHEYLVGGNCWIKSRVSYLNRSPEHGVKLSEDQSNDSYIRLAIHREFSWIINKLKPSDTKRFFKYDKRLSAEPCSACYKVFSKCEFFDGKWTDSFVDTLQEKINTNNEMECVVCGHLAKFSEIQCKECEGYVVDESTGKCSHCATYGN